MRLTSKLNELMWKTIPGILGIKDDQIALELETNPVIVALLDNLGLMFDC